MKDSNGGGASQLRPPLVHRRTLRPQASKAAEITAGKCEVDFDFNPRGTERDSRARAFIIANKAAYSAGHSESVVMGAHCREWAGGWGRSVVKQLLN